uniref:Uncharacterized protein n=1 Tax=Timema tahoe TaxID=61484 RepID=A0A7R9IQS4_9NEOP|nr:unnamed protein product [Timema tahoe]
MLKEISVNWTECLDFTAEAPSTDSVSVSFYIFFWVSVTTTPMTRALGTRDYFWWNPDEYKFLDEELVECGDVASSLSNSYNLNFHEVLNITKLYYIWFYDETTPETSRQTWIQQLNKDFRQSEFNKSGISRSYKEVRNYQRFLLGSTLQLYFCPDITNVTKLKEQDQWGSFRRVHTFLNRITRRPVLLTFLKKKPWKYEESLDFFKDKDVVPEGYAKDVKVIFPYWSSCHYIDAARDAQEFFSSARVSLSLGLRGFRTFPLRKSNLYATSFRRVKHLLTDQVVRYITPMKEFPDLHFTTHGEYLLKFLRALQSFDGLISDQLKNDIDAVMPYYDKNYEDAGERRYRDSFGDQKSLQGFQVSDIAFHDFNSNSHISYPLSSDQICPVCNRTAQKYAVRYGLNVTSTWKVLHFLHSKYYSSQNETCRFKSLRRDFKYLVPYLKSAYSQPEPDKILIMFNFFHHLMMITLKSLLDMDWLVHDGNLEYYQKVQDFFEAKFHRSFEYYPRILKRPFWYHHYDNFIEGLKSIDDITSEWILTTLEGLSELGVDADLEEAIRIILPYFDYESSDFYVQAIAMRQFNKYEERGFVLENSLKAFDVEKLKRDGRSDSFMRVENCLQIDFPLFGRYLPDVRAYVFTHRKTYFMDCLSVMLSSPLVPSQVKSDLMVLMPSFNKTHLESMRIIGGDLGGERFYDYLQCNNAGCMQLKVRTCRASCISFVGQEFPPASNVKEE